MYFSDNVCFSLMWFVLMLLCHFEVKFKVKIIEKLLNKADVTAGTNVFGRIVVLPVVPPLTSLMLEIMVRNGGRRRSKMEEKSNRMEGVGEMLTMKRTQSREADVMEVREEDGGREGGEER